MMRAARREPSEERTVRVNVMVECGKRCVCRVEERAEERVFWISWRRL